MIIKFLISTAIGGIIGFLASYGLWQLQLRKQRKNTAIMLLIDIMQFQEKYSRNKSLKVQVETRLGIYGALGIFSRSIYDFSIYSAVIPNLPLLEREIMMKIIAFYRALIYAEQVRKLWAETPTPILEGECRENIDKAYQLSPSVCSLLKKYVDERTISELSLMINESL